jgi:hypothetical protein
MQEREKTYHWAAISWHGRGDQADEVFVHVVRTAKGREAAEAAAREWGSKHLAPAAKTSISYIGQSHPVTIY